MSKVYFVRGVEFATLEKARAFVKKLVGRVTIHVLWHDLSIYNKPIEQYVDGKLVWDCKRLTILSYMGQAPLPEEELT